MTTDNTAIVFGMLCLLLAGIFYTSASQNTIWKRVYKVVPALLLCYFLPSLLTSLGIVDPQGKAISDLYYVATRFLLPAALILLTLSIDLKSVLKLGPKALIMFFTATVGIVIGGPLTLLLFAAISPELVGGAGVEELWRGMSTIAGSWIGGSANQVAMKELYAVSDALYSNMIIVDVLVANIWMAVLLYGAAKSEAVDRFFKANNSSVVSLIKKMEDFQATTRKTPDLTHFILIIGVTFGCVGIAHLGSEQFVPFFKELEHPIWSNFSFDKAFFWIVIIATSLGLLLSFTPARKWEGYGASKLGSVCIYLLVAVIGTKMNVLEIADHFNLFLIGLVWILFHVALLFVVGKLIRAPFFFLAVGSKANIGGAASAPVVASAFHPSLAPVGVLLAVLGYALGSYAAILCANLMKLVSA